MRSGLRSGLTHYATVSFLLFHASQSCPFRLLFAKSCSLACLLPWLDLTFHSRLLWRMRISSFSIVWYHRSPIVCPHLFFFFQSNNKNWMHIEPYGSFTAIKVSLLARRCNFFLSLCLYLSVSRRWAFRMVDRWKSTSNITTLRLLSWTNVRLKRRS